MVAYLSRVSQHPAYARAALSTLRFTFAVKRSTSTPIAEALTLRGPYLAFALQAACSRAVYNQKRIRAVWDTGRPLSASKETSMIEITQVNASLDEAGDENACLIVGKRVAKRVLRCKDSEIKSIELHRKSIDARKNETSILS